MIDLRLPNITGATEREQLQQTKSYLHQLVEQLNWALNNIDTTSNTAVVTPTARSLAPVASGSVSQSDPQATFASIKSLIIKSAEIVDAYYDEINARLEGLYVAQSDFGTYVEQTNALIEANSKGITQTYTNVQTLQSTVGGIDTTVQTLGGTVTTLGGTVSNINTNVATLGGTVTNLDNTVTNLGGTVQNINSTVQTIGGTVETLGGTVQTLDSTLQGVDNKVTTVGNKVDTVEGKVDAVDGKVDTVAAEASTNLYDAKTGILENLNELSGIVDGQSTAIKDIKEAADESVQRVQDSVDGLSSEINTVKTDVDEKTKALDEAIKATNEVVATVTSTIKTGELYRDQSDLPVYGLEIGQRNTIGGVETFNKYARFTSNRLSFYDAGGYEVAYISDSKLYITHAEITETLKIGGYSIDTSNGIAFKWAGGN